MEKEKERNRQVLVLFSGGKDSFLSTCRLLNEGFDVTLVTYENGCGLKSENVSHGVNRIIEKYGKTRVKFLGIKNTSGIWREFFLPYFNLKPSEIISKFGEVTTSQFNCTTCRMAMYILSVVICEKLNISTIAEGARRDQGFIIEQDEMLERFRNFLSKFGIELLLPVQNLTSDWLLKNEMLISGFVPKTLEPQCLIGTPLNKKVLDAEILNGTLKFFDEYLLDKSLELIELVKKTDVLNDKEFL